jgi:protocatechuate 3,4-dioxygenase, beta subunit
MPRTLALCALTIFLAAPSHALDQTPSQIEGPYYPTRKPAETDADLTQVGGGQKSQGQALSLTGLVVDHGGKPIAGAVVEIWQADHQGIYLHPRDSRVARRDTNFQGFGTMITNDTGAFLFRTIVPGRYEGRPPHIHVKVTPPDGATLTTQLYFKGDADLSRDGIARSLGKGLARVTLELIPVRPGEAASPLESSIILVVKRGRKG